MNVLQVQLFFFEAMQNGYASNGNKTRVLGMPGFWEIEFNRGDWRCVDRWGGPSDSFYTTGATTIWYQNVPVWAMSYTGWYNHLAVDVLKQALCANYTEKIFRGCRGPMRFVPKEQKMKSLEYVNRCEGLFEDFTGREEVRDLNTLDTYGHHRYMGSSLYAGLCSGV